MQKIDRKEFVQGVAALAAATAVGISFGKEGNNMKKTELKTLANENAFDLIGKEWMLVTAGNKEKFNTMTASWGGIGWLWNRPVAFVFIRPERYTHDFIERESRLTLSFYKEEFRGILHFCGTKSGRDVDKVKAYVFFKGRSILFKEQGEVLLLRFANDLEEYAKVDQMPVLEGKRMTIQLSPKKGVAAKKPQQVQAPTEENE